MGRKKRLFFLAALEKRKQEVVVEVPQPEPQPEPPKVEEVVDVPVEEVAKPVAKTTKVSKPK